MLEFDRRVFALLERLHEAPGDAPAWMEFLVALRAEISPDAAVLFASQAHESRPGVIAGTEIGLRLTQPGDLLPSMPHPDASAAPVGSVHELAADGAAFGASALFRDMLEPAGILPGPGLLVVTERSERHVRAVTLVLPRSPGWKPTAMDRALIERLAPHMVLARRVHTRLIERGRDAEALAAAFDHLVIGVVLLDQRLRVSYANLSAAEILGVKPGFASRAQLTAEAPDERTRACEHLVRREPTGERDAQVYAHPKDSRPLHVLTTPFGWRSGEAIGGARFSRALFIGDPKRRAGDPIGVLRALYGMTRGETRLSMLLLGGCSVEEAADLLGISVGTARGVLKKVFDKTGTNRQAGLVRLLLTGFGQVRQEEATEPPPAPSKSRRAPRRRASA